MKVLLFDDNLLWSSRFTKSLRALGHEPAACTGLPETTDAAAAIVNLGSKSSDPALLVPHLHALGLYVIAHAGHKDKELHELGRNLGCDYLATNGEITFKLADILGLVEVPGLPDAPG